MGGTVYKRCDQCGRWVHRDETVLREPRRTNHVAIPRRICLNCVDGYDLKQSKEFARLAAAGDTFARRSRR